LIFVGWVAIGKASTELNRVIPMAMDLSIFMVIIFGGVASWLIFLDE
jgi:hypothetical protein